jgi:hypothetical protein
MSLPKFTAEASLYKSNVTYQLEFSERTSMESVIPSRPIDPVPVLCRISCFRRFGTYSNARLDECLLDCGD